MNIYKTEGQNRSSENGVYLLRWYPVEGNPAVNQ